MSLIANIGTLSSLLKVILILEIWRQFIQGVGGGVTSNAVAWLQCETLGIFLYLPPSSGRNRPRSLLEPLLEQRASRAIVWPLAPEDSRSCAGTIYMYSGHQTRSSTVFANDPTSSVFDVFHWLAMPRNHKRWLRHHFNMNIRCFCLLRARWMSCERKVPRHLIVHSL